MCVYITCFDTASCDLLFFLFLFSLLSRFPSLIQAVRGCCKGLATRGCCSLSVLITNTGLDVELIRFYGFL